MRRSFTLTGIVLAFIVAAFATFADTTSASAQSVQLGRPDSLYTVQGGRTYYGPGSGASGEICNLGDYRCNARRNSGQQRQYQSRSYRQQRVVTSRTTHRHNSGGYARPLNRPYVAPRQRDHVHAGHGYARPLNQPYVGPQTIDGKYTGKACKRRDGSIGREGIGEDGQIGCWRH